MRRGERVYHHARRGIVVIIAVLLYCILSTSALAATTSTSSTTATSTISETYDFITDRYGSSQAATQGTSQAVQPSSTKTKEDIDREQFNGEVLDTIIYILGGLAGFAMLLHISAFGVVHVFPSTNRFFEKFKVIGIDGYDEGIVVPTIKILLLGVLSYLCISGMMKQFVGFILGLFTVATS